ncbi:hypothetical protein HWV62_11786 [Athelia sp. TMB]|nr:hypothetical protein HWV62_11786 [Athelia sp. TMB]
MAAFEESPLVFKGLPVLAAPGVAMVSDATLCPAHSALSSARGSAQFQQHIMGQSTLTVYAVLGSLLGGLRAVGVSDDTVDARLVGGDILGRAEAGSANAVIDRGEDAGAAGLALRRDVGVGARLALN